VGPRLSRRGRCRVAPSFYANVGPTAMARRTVRGRLRANRPGVRWTGQDRPGFANTHYPARSQGSREHETCSAQHHDSKYDEKSEKTKPSLEDLLPVCHRLHRGATVWVVRVPRASELCRATRAPARPWPAPATFSCRRKFLLTKRVMISKSCPFNRQEARFHERYRTSAYW
jgi:hypothetical protein